MTTAVAGGKPSMSRRTAAAVALAALVAALVYLAVSAVSRWYVLLASVVSLGVTVIAAWYILSRRGVTRALAGVVAGLALLVFTVVVIASESIIVLVVGLALAAVSVGAARYALSPASAVSAAERAPNAQHPVLLERAPKAQHPVLLMNLKSGGGKAERFRLVDLCRQRGIEPVVLHPGDDLRQLARDAVARGADLLGMAGGDGSQAVVASVASEQHIPFVVVPAGTRNHFALDLGLDRDDVPGALDAYEDGVDTKVDLAEVNGRVFVNNASMGVYAKIVQSGDYRDAKLQTAAAMLPDLLGPEATPLDLRFALPSGEEAVTAQLLLVSNNPYQLARLRGGGTRERLDSGVLGIAFARVDTAVEAEKLARTGGRRPRSALRQLERVDDVGVRGAFLGSRGGRRRWGGHDPPATPALRQPARRADDPAAAHCCHGAVSGHARRTGHDDAHGGCAVADSPRPSDGDQMTNPTLPEPVEERLADRLSTRHKGAPPSLAVRVLRRLGRLDRAAYRAVADLSTPRLDRPLRQVSKFANFSKPWLVIAGMLALFGGAKGRRAAVTGVAAIGVTSFVVNQPMKLAGGRRRPDRTQMGVPENRWVSMPSSTSFPSGHSASAAAFAISVG